MYVCVPICLCVPVVCRGQRRVSDPLQLELQITVTLPMLLSESELQSSAEQPALLATEL